MLRRESPLVRIPKLWWPRQSSHNPSRKLSPLWRSSSSRRRRILSPSLQLPLLWTLPRWIPLNNYFFSRFVFVPSSVAGFCVSCCCCFSFSIFQRSQWHVAVIFWFLTSRPATISQNQGRHPRPQCHLNKKVDLWNEIAKQNVKKLAYEWLEAQQQPQGSWPHRRESCRHCSWSSSHSLREIKPIIFRWTRKKKEKKKKKKEENI